MTFYNIIFGLLFIGSFREVIYALSQGPDWKLFCLSATLSVLIFSDTIYTAVVIEGKKSSYSMPMKLLDLTSFIVLSFAVVLLNPVTNDMFEVNVSGVLYSVVGNDWGRESLFWALLAFYMTILIVWNILLGINSVMWCHQWVKWVQPVLAVLFVGMEALCWLSGGDESILRPVRWALLAVVVTYLLAFKTYLSDVLDARVTLKPLTRADVRAIRKWPRYEGKLAIFDYALQKGGWLDEYPESPENHRYGIWQEGELVGFSLLVRMQQGSAEFYIAIHPELLRKNIGREATTQTVRLGFSKHKLNFIYLKVRDWHTARAMYEQIGFAKTGEGPVDMHGQPVNFVFMEIRRPGWNPPPKPADSEQTLATVSANP